MKLSHLTVGLLALAAARLCTAQEVPLAATTQLGVRIVPTRFRDSGERSISLLDPAQHFAVVVTNSGKTTIRLWRESCSWGYTNLSFEAQGDDGKKVLVTKKPRGWEKNFPDWIAILELTRFGGRV